MADLSSLLRNNIRSLTPYSSARDEYKGEDAVFLDANENPYNSPFNRYPDPLQIKLKKRISEIKGVAPENIFLGNGSDEAIDLLIRAFCEPGEDNILAIKPTYGMYKVCADINRVEYRESLLNEHFQVNVKQLTDLADNHSKLMFLCSPNNPTSNSLDTADILQLVKQFKGLVILDEAYIDFSIHPSMAAQLKSYSNLVILQTFSKAWGMAGIRLGMAFADIDIIQVLNRIKYPYNVNILTQKVALEHLVSAENKDKWVNQILEQRNLLYSQLSRFSMVRNILPGDANFLMVKFDDPKKVFDFLIEKKIIVRDRSKVSLCEGYLRITVGTSEENRMLINALYEY
jgi:histidinol-phosphate aminotransferase